MPLTDAAIKNAKPSDKTACMFDGGGMCLEISPAGGKWWRLKYRYDGKEKRLSLGVYPDVSMKDARQRRDDTRKLLADGVVRRSWRGIARCSPDCALWNLRYNATRSAQNCSMARTP